MDVKKKTNSLLKLIAVVIATGLITFGCQPQGEVAPKGDGPELAGLGAEDSVHTGPVNRCGEMITGNLVDGAGNTASGDVFGPTSYGTFEMMRAGAEMIVTYQLSRGYFCSAYSHYYGPSELLPIKQDGNVDAENLPMRTMQSPSRNVGEWRWPYNDAVLCPNDIVYAGNITIHQLDFLGNSFGETELYFEGTPVGTDGWNTVSFCAPLCAGQLPPCAVPTVGPGDDLSSYECHPSGKVTVCHVPPGNPSNMQEICISVNALPAHVESFKPANNPCMGHHSGCHIGPCDPCGPGSTLAAAGSSNCPGN